jgi:hypothetical protein
MARRPSKPTPSQTKAKRPLFEYPEPQAEFPPGKEGTRGGSAGSSTRSKEVLPSDRVQALVALLRPAGAELARRWLAALLLVDEADRPGLVAAVERRIADLYGWDRQGTTDAQAPSDMEVIHPPTQRPGYVEQVITTYSRPEGKAQSGRDAQSGARPAPSERKKKSRGA